MDDKPLLLVNLTANSNHWLGVAVEGTKSNRDGIGAQATVFAGGHKWTQEVRSGSTYLSNSDFGLHFGLGSATAVDHIDVLWPSGLNERFPGCTADRFVNLVEATGSALPLHK